MKEEKGRNFIKEFGNKIKRNVETLKENEKELRRLRAEALRKLNLKERKQIELIKQRAEKERKALLERFDKKEVLMGAKLLSQKQKQTKSQIMKEKTALKKNKYQIKNIIKELRKINPVKKIEE